MLCLFQEVTNGTLCIKRGLGEVQRSSYTINEYHPGLLLLANGFEKLMKCLLCLLRYAESDCFPPHTEMKKWGHKLNELLDLLVEKCSASN